MTFVIFFSMTDSGVARTELWLDVIMMSFWCFFMYRTSKSHYYDIKRKLQTRTSLSVMERKATKVTTLKDHDLKALTRAVMHKQMKALSEIHPVTAERHVPFNGKIVRFNNCYKDWHINTFIVHLKTREHCLVQPCTECCTGENIYKGMWIKYFVFEW